MEQKAIRVVANEDNTIADQLNNLLSLDDLRSYGFSGYSVAYIEQISILNAYVCIALVRVFPNGKKTVRKNLK